MLKREQYIENSPNHTPIQWPTFSPESTQNVIYSVVVSVDRQKVITTQETAKSKYFTSDEFIRK